MRPLIFSFIILVLPVMANANLQFGVGSTLGTICPTQQKPAQAATDPQDYLDNLDTQISELQDELNSKRDAADKKERTMEAAMRKMRRIFTSSGIAAIEEHRSHRRNRSDYNEFCPADSNGSYQLIPRRSIASDSAPAVIGGVDANGNPLVLPGVGQNGAPIVLPGNPTGNPNGNPGGNNGGGQQPQSTFKARFSFFGTFNLDDIFGNKKRQAADDGDGGDSRPTRSGRDLLDVPSGFCADANYWDAVALDDGKVKSDLCTKEGLPQIFKEHGDNYDSDVEACQDGMRAYYRATEDMDDIQEDLSPLERQLAQLKKKRRRALNEIAEGTFSGECTTGDCNNSKAGSADSLMASLAPTMVQLFAALMMNDGNNQQQQRPPDVIVANNNGYPGSAPIILPPAQSALPGQNLPDYYPAQVQGMYNGGSGNQNYGSVDGGIGQGAFSCSDMDQANSALDFPQWMINMFNSGKGGLGNNGGNNIGGPAVIAPYQGGGGPPTIVAAQVGDYYNNMLQFQQGVGLLNGSNGAPPVLPGLSAEPPAVLPGLTTTP